MPPWTESDIATLKRVYPVGGRFAVNKLLPHHSALSVAAYARTLRLRLIRQTDLLIPGYRTEKIVLLRELAVRHVYGKTERWFEVRCDCGTKWSVRLRALIGKRSITSCGCLNGLLQRQANKEKGRIAGLLPKFNQYKRWCATARRKSFRLSFDTFKTLVLGDCGYCGTPASEARRGLNGIDRVNNALGYSKANCVPCCKTCNYAKGAMSHSDFIAWIERLLKHHGARR